MCSHGSGQGPCSAAVETFEHHRDGMAYNMERFINKGKVVVLNEAVEGSGTAVFKHWDERLDRTHFVESDVDEELLFSIPFTANVKLSGICFVGDLDGSFPSFVRIFKDRENISFDEAESAKPDQQMDLKQDDQALTDYPLISSKFASVGHITLHFPKNFGSDQTRLYYIGLRGEFHSDFRDKIVIANYEAKPVPDDHKGEIRDQMNHQVC